MRALISVSDKSGVVEFAKGLEKLGVEIISTGGTYKKLQSEGVKVVSVSDITGFSECLDGRVKTLHPSVHGGILAMRDRPEHMEQIKNLGIEPIDIVAINLYPFKETIMKPEVTLADAIENIDIGGPTMLRAAAKNHKDVAVICDPSDYDTVLEEMKQARQVSYDVKYRLALKVFEHTAAYDAMISAYLREQIDAPLPDNPTFTFEKLQDLRYGENPHQSAAYYKEIKPFDGALVNAKQLHGKELSFNNINDTNGAIDTLREFCCFCGCEKDMPTVVAVKHANPCGVATGDTLLEAYKKAHDCDPVSIFGGIIACNRVVDKETAEEISKIFFEILIAPDFDEAALEVLQKKKNVRLLKLPAIGDRGPENRIDMKKVSGGLLIQNTDMSLFNVDGPTPDQPGNEDAPKAGAAGTYVFDDKLKVVTKKAPTEAEIKDMEMAMKVVKHTKSNGIVFVKDGKTIAIGPGQTNRIWAVENCIKRCLSDMKGAVMASDAFFPFNDCVTAAAQAGATAIIQPGGSIRDQESIDKADELEISMVFSGQRHFKH
ncbi:MAG: bifunctional phosphoribosylaminoimidazolecarboxamide formyltransferase/IMP cyclohydrolase [Clostridiales bacterium]|nr:bifunctional phosphoribosylaminoimidazolecarboxamide formyltransferase/IMP cyclohydrolase [Clostridiales bacterium]